MSVLKSKCCNAFVGIKYSNEAHGYTTTTFICSKCKTMCASIQIELDDVIKETFDNIFKNYEQCNNISDLKVFIKEARSVLFEAIKEQEEYKQFILRYSYENYSRV